MKSVNQKKGFTLIEMLVVIAIIGLLATIVSVAVGRARTQARDSRRIAEVTQIANAMELYAAENPTTGFPANLGVLTDGGFVKGIRKSGTNLVDPKGTQNYQYAAWRENLTSPYTNYHVGINLEVRAELLRSDDDCDSTAVPPTGSWSVGTPFNGKIVPAGTAGAYDVVATPNDAKNGLAALNCVPLDTY